LSITKRQSDILGRFVNVFRAAVSTFIRISQAVPSLDESLQSELITIDEACKPVSVIDVTTPFENRCAVFQAARHKKQKEVHPTAGAIQSTGM
jgi:hypothetical protein